MLSKQQLKSQEYLIPCFYCHIDVIVEMKAEAIKHWEGEVVCEACHGPRGEHVDVEDNSVKPDSIWTDSNVHMLCRDCHADVFESYNKSEHAKLLFGKDKKEKGVEVPSCISCHGAHGFKSETMIKEICLECHTPLPKTCIMETSKKYSHEIPMTCKSCHNSHALDLLQQNKKEGR